MQILVAQIDARRHYAVPRALNAVNSLARLETTLCARHPLVRLASALPQSWQPAGLRRLLDRKVTGVPDHKIASSSLIELRNLGVKSCRSTSNTAYERYVQRNGAFGKHIVSRGFAGADAVYAFNGAAIEILRAAKKQGLCCILDQTLAPLSMVEKLLSEERKRYPDWEARHYSHEGWQSLADREEEEWRLADRIICGSRFVASSVIACGVSGTICRVVPYDPPPTEICRLPRFSNGKVKVLFAGTICLRKGIQYLIEALEQLGSQHFEVRAVGPLEVTEQIISRFRHLIRFTGPCQRSQMNEHFSWADVLVLPSLAEGSANVTYEALASGIPVITTENSGSIVTHGYDGWIIPIRDSGAIAELLELLSRDRALLRQMSDNAFVTAQRQCSENNYGKRLLEAIGSESQ